MNEETQVFIIATLWLIVHEVTDDTTLAIVAGVVSTVGFALYLFMVVTDLWLKWRNRRGTA